MTAHLGPAATAFVDGQLDHRRRDEVLAHLLHCAQCRADVRAVRALKDSLRSIEPAVPSDLSLRLLAAAQAPALASIPRQPRRGHRRIRRTAVGGALVVLGVGGTLSLAGPPPPGAPAKVDPSSVRFVIDHATTAGEVPFSEPEVVPVSSANRVP
ncbi:MAG: putative transrane anti-sigma factor [Frankiales bacterium]|nr:putative transrane anti-sigma factor [Frankiales bacterium]